MEMETWKGCHAGWTGVPIHIKYSIKCDQWALVRVIYGFSLSNPAIPGHRGWLKNSTTMNRYITNAIMWVQMFTVSVCSPNTDLRQYE